jgi:hypothetical protein
VRLFSRLFFSAVPLAAALAGCGGGSTNYTPLSGAFSATQTVTIENTASPLSLPSSHGFSGSVLLSGAVVPGGTTLTETLTNVRPANAPALQAVARAESRSTEAVLAGSQVVYVALTASATFSETAPPQLTLKLPPADVVAGTTYYLALYDPTRPSLGWQQTFAGPAAISGSTLTFTPPGGTFTFAANEQYDFGVYTYTGPPPVVVTSSTTQTYVGTPQTFTASEAAYGGAFGASAACTNGANSSGTVGTVTPASATPAAAGGAVTFTFTPQNAGTCTVTVTGGQGPAGTILFNVSATNLGVQ